VRSRWRRQWIFPKLGRNAANARESVRKANRNRPWPIGSGCIAAPRVSVPRDLARRVVAASISAMARPVCWATCGKTGAGIGEETLGRIAAAIILTGADARAIDRDATEPLDASS
jgi:hypothetical protein